MNTVFNIIKENIQNPNAFFVFPTDIAASTWSEYILKTEIVEAISSERFTAWDSFKAECIRSQQQNKTSIPSVLRKFFAQSIIEKNKKDKIFFEIINPSYIHTSASFALWVSTLLPQLASWEEKVLHENVTLDAEDKDFLLLKKEYESFLDSNNLFDPAWERPPFHTDGTTYFILYPNVLQDFYEYKEILENSPSIELVYCEKETNLTNVLQYTNARSELKNTALYIKNICLPVLEGGKGLAYSDIAVSVKDLENYEPYIKQEFLLYNIPFRLRSGKPLVNYSAGRFFSLIQDCYTENFSFNSVKNLICDPVFPWSDTVVAEQLIDFGIKNNCLCSYDNIDVWEKAFKSSYKEERARDFYKSLKKTIKSIVTSSSFYYLRKHYIEFRTLFFNMTLITEETNTIMSRCIAELTSLIELEQSFPDATVCENPLSFFIEQLQSKEYVVQTKENGVNIFTYKLAACAPFKQHIILDSSQNALNVSNTSLQFLRENKRKLLNLHNENTSSIFVQLYIQHSDECTRFSFARKGFSGYEIPFNTLLPVETYTQTECEHKDMYENYNDSYINERKLFLKELNTISDLHLIQKEGFYHWVQTSSITPYSSNDNFLELLRKSIKQKYFKGESLQVSATSLNLFYDCPIKWLFKSILNLKDFTLESNLIDDVYIGTFYHEVINRVLTKIQQDKMPLHIQEDGSLPIEVKNYIIEKTTQVITGFPETCKITNISDLTIEVFKSQGISYIQTLLEFFTEFSIYFLGSYISDIEKEIVIKNDGYDIVGKIDCVLDYPGLIKTTSNKKESPIEFEAGKYIVDFKTGMKNSRKDSIKKENQELKDFQLPLYTYLYEQHFLGGKCCVQGATFFSITKKKPTPIFGLLKKNNTYSPNKSKDQLHRTGENAAGFSFEPTMNETLLAVENFVNVLQDNNLSIFTDKMKWGHYPNGTKVKFETCLLCGYKKICRTTYSISGE